MSRTALIGAIAALIVIGGPSAIAADDKAEIARDSQAALTSLYANVPAAKALGAKATAILVFPKITKAGLGIGGQHGDGALMKGGSPVAYYKHERRVGWPPGRRPDLWLRDVLHERQGIAAAR